MGRFGSFILGMAIAAAVLGVFMLLLSAISGDDSSPAQRQASNPPATGESTPEVAVTAVLSAAPSATPPPAVTEDPSPPPAEAEVATATPESMACCQDSSPSPAEGAVSPDFAPPAAPPPPAALRPAQAPPPPTARPPSPPPAMPPVEPPPVEPPPPTQPAPPPAAPTRDPSVQSFASVLASVTGDASSLAARIAAPDFASASWSEATVALARKVELAGGMVSVMSPPACLQGAHASLRSATIELSRASGLIVSAVQQGDSRLLASGAERLAAGRAALPVAQAQFAAANC